MTKTIEQKAFKFIDEYHLIEKGDKILVALSGGADSIFLLSFLIKFKKRFGIEVAAFHLNHKLRGKSADTDEKFCSDFCKQNKIKFICVKKDVKSYAKKLKVSVEEAGREIRYLELNKAAEKIGCTKIATAHNASDNVETILLNFVKGAGIKGLSGIPVGRDNIIRPILCLSSYEIRKYLKANKIPFRIDESNLDSDYERNFLRNEIIPKLKARLNPRVEEKISNTSKIISEINSFIEKLVEQLSHEAVKLEGKVLRINTKKISKLDKSFLSIFLKSVVENNFNIELSSENIYALVDLVNSQAGKEVHLKENIIASKERNELIIGRKPSVKFEKAFHKIKVGQSLRIDGKIISISEVNRKMFKFTPNKCVEFIAADGFSNVFEIRRWKDGDKFQPIGMKGTKKISDFLADQKISSSRKKEHLVLTNSGKIVWVIGFRIDERFKVISKTKKILKLTVTNK
ncbi:MAG TPA: tRNA lysidine(34) synthetase TilS [Ignavibacteriaceae bacterium]|nr:tRNA lysidine(34) synthetase TilS [Ignavibacteriaceae bacterium]